MIKAIFFDIDGTLISKRNPRIQAPLKETLDALRSKGILLFVATGRHSLEIEELGLNQDYQFDGYVTLNGCYCYNHQEVIYKGSIHPDDVEEVVKIVNKKSIACMFVEARRMYINMVNQRVEAAQAAISTPVPDIEDISRALHHDIYQIIPYVNDEEIGEILQVTKHCKGTRWHPLAYDIIGNNGGKSKGIEAVLKYYELQKEEIMAFGDGHNDIDMLSYAGIGIAMENGDELAKQASDFVTKHVDEEGIKHALIQYKVL